LSCDVTRWTLRKPVATAKTSGFRPGPRSNFAATKSSFFSRLKGTGAPAARDAPAAAR
jgi:hypothetical protein